MPEDQETLETTLLAALKQQGAELKALLDECNGHWNYEDKVYRFYHKSFKVYRLQETTTKIVKKLQGLMPDRQLNEWFVEIVKEGTGKTFELSHNAYWLENTRPILEAFFHAKYFLEMACKYTELEKPPTMLPSGYAGLLYLFNMR